MKELFFIGSGKMATAIAGGIIKAGLFTPEQMGAFDPDTGAAANFTKLTGVKAVSDSPVDGISSGKAVVIAVKPQVLDKALAEFKELLKDKLILSIAAGITLEHLAQITGARRIVRIMPNTPALVGCGAAAYAGNSGVMPEDLELTEKIFSAVGTVCRLKETDLDAVTALSGSGPAYVFEFIQALADGGVAEGLPRDTAQLLAVQTLIGAAKMVLETGEHPSSLKDKVTSPGGTTSRGLEVLAKNAFSGIVMQAVRAAAVRSRELGKK
ncbi:MAG: pyrroline-5-carboxylate reductase [Lentisphaeria bacterium]|nr:pyrroline-5-carboxylate reductase [Lentisphaeria bacterium]